MKICMGFYKIVANPIHGDPFFPNFWVGFFKSTDNLGAMGGKISWVEKKGEQTPLDAPAMYAHTLVDQGEKNQVPYHQFLVHIEVIPPILGNAT